MPTSREQKELNRAQMHHFLHDVDLAPCYFAALEDIHVRYDDVRLNSWGRVIGEPPEFSFEARCGRARIVIDMRAGEDGESVVYTSRFVKSGKILATRRAYILKGKPIVA